jgi:adenylate cyclase
MEVRLKGVKQPVTIYDVGGIGGKYNLFLTKEEELFFPMPEEIPIQYMLVDGKHIDERVFKGSLVKLSAKGALVRCDNGDSQGTPPPLCNIKLNLLTSHASTEVSEDIYAKVLEKPADNETFYISFTAKPLEVRARLDALYKSITG